jgi:hypothetical protein
VNPQTCTHKNPSNPDVLTLRGQSDGKKLDYSCVQCGAVVKTILTAGKILQVMKNGDYRKLPQSSSPLWMSQWAVQGTAKAPYIVSKKVFAANYSASTTDQGWACSCPNFTQHTPRTECKHILKVMLGEGVKPNSAPVASLPDDQQDAFQKFLRQQAERGTPALPAGKHKPLFTTGRRFR